MTSGQAPRTALVVEDEPAINEALTQRLRAEGYAVEQAFDGPSAVGLAPEPGNMPVPAPRFGASDECAGIWAAFAE